MQNVNSNDSVEVRFPTQDGYLWRRATVVSVHTDSVVVMYRDGKRAAVRPHDVRAREVHA